MSSAPAALAHIVMNVPKLVLWRFSDITWHELLPDYHSTLSSGSNFTASVFESTRSNFYLCYLMLSSFWAIIYTHYKTPPWKDQPVLPFLSEAAAGTNITSHQVIIISQMNLRCWICCACLVLIIQCISTGTMHTIGKHTTFIIDWYESI